MAGLAEAKNLAQASSGAREKMGGMGAGRKWRNRGLVTGVSFLEAGSTPGHQGRIKGD